MEGFTFTHDACGKPAQLTYYITTDWHYDGEDEMPYDVYNLTLGCTACGVRVEPTPTPE